MGWTSSRSHQSKKQLTAEILSDYEREEKYTVLGSASAQGVFYLAVRTADAPKGIILVYLVEKHRGEWAWKGMDESMGPVILNCPLSLLELTEGDGSQTGKSWREAVRAYHAAKRAANRRSYPIGSRVSVYGKAYRVTGMASKKSYEVVSEESGQMFRCTAVKMQPLDNVTSI